MSRLITFTASALSIAASALVAAPAIAASDHVRLAIEHFNRDVHRPSDRVAMPAPDQVNAIVSTRGSGSVGRSYRRFNESADRASDITGQVGATSVAARPSHGAEIFDAIRAEDSGQ